MKVHERLYALAATSEPDAARELTECADAARDMLAALRYVAGKCGDVADCGPEDPDRLSHILSDMEASIRAAIAKARGEA